MGNEAVISRVFDKYSQALRIAADDDDRLVVAFDALLWLAIGDIYEVVDADRASTREALDAAAVSIANMSDRIATLTSDFDTVALANDRLVNEIKALKDERDARIQSASAPASAPAPVAGRTMAEIIFEKTTEPPAVRHARVRPRVKPLTPSQRRSTSVYTRVALRNEVIDNLRQMLHDNERTSMSEYNRIYKLAPSSESVVGALNTTWNALVIEAGGVPTESTATKRQHATQAKA